MVVVASALVVAGCSRSHSIPNDIAVLDVHGSVQRLESEIFYAEENSEGAPEKASEEPYMRTVMMFDNDGWLTSAETFKDGTLCLWEERLYDDTGLNTIKVNSVGYGCNRVVEIQPNGTAEQLWQIFDESGEMVAEHTVTLRKDVYNGIREGRVFYSTRLHDGRMESMRSVFPDHEEFVEYEYDDAGELTGCTLRNEADGTSLRTYCDKTDFDERHNWTRRILYDVDDAGGRTLCSIEERTIVYY